MTDIRPRLFTADEVRALYVADCRRHYSEPLSFDGGVSSLDVLGRIGCLDACDARTDDEEAELQLLYMVFYHGRLASRHWYDGTAVFAGVLPDDEDPAYYAKFEVNGRVFYAEKDDDD